MFGAYVVSLICHLGTLPLQSPPFCLKAKGSPAPLQPPTHPIVCPSSGEAASASLSSPPPIFLDSLELESQMVLSSSVGAGNQSQPESVLLPTEPPL